MPRPLPAHLAAATMLWMSSRAALPSLSSASLPSNAAGDRLRGLAREIEAFGIEAVAAALDAVLARRARAFLAGLDAYRNHKLCRRAPRVPVVWRQGTTRLLDYGGGRSGRAMLPTVLVVPSLVNRFHVLDLLRERSFLRHLAGRGLRPLVVDWGEPGDAEKGFALDDYVAGRLDAALAASVALGAAPIGVLGYCMGGLLALALALRHPHRVACLALLATPWDFHAEREAQARLLGLVAAWLPYFCGDAGTVPVAVVQTLFLSLDPFLAERKFIRFAALDPTGEAARSFVALEDWINDGVPLALGVAEECARSWYGDNLPGRGLWRVDGKPVLPSRLRCPALVVVPSRDRIVPPRSAEPLAAALADATVLRPPFGHIGMMAAAAAPTAVWDPIAEWLGARLDSAGRGLLDSPSAPT